MTPVYIGILGLIVLTALLVFRVPGGLSLITAAALGASLLNSPGMALAELGGDILRIFSHYDLSLIPLVIMTGFLFDMGTRELSNVRRAGQEDDSAALAHTDEPSPGLAPRRSASHFLTPPCVAPVIALIVFAFLSGGSVGKFLMAGVVPGIIALTLLALSAAIIQIIAPRLLPEAIKRALPFRVKTLARFLVAALVAAAITAGIFFGFITPTEASAVGAFILVLYMAFSRRLTPKGLLDALQRSVIATARMFLLITGGSLFGLLMTRSLLHVTLLRYIAGSAIPPFLVLGFVLLFYTVMGFIFDGHAALAIVTPIVYPIVHGLGYSGNWFGVLAVMALMFGLLSKEDAFMDITRFGLHIRRVVRTKWPFWVALLIACLIVTLAPGLVTYLPRIMLGL